MIVQQQSQPLAQAAPAANMAVAGSAPQAAYKNNVASYMKKEMNREICTFLASGQAKTGFPNLDQIIGHLFPGFYVLGAGSSLGKTTFALQLADQLIRDCEPVIYFTMEQSQLELVSKCIARRVALKCRTAPKYAVTALEVRRGASSQDIKDAYDELLLDADVFTIVQGDFSTDMSEIENTVEDYVKAVGKVPIIVIDYLQIIQEGQMMTDKAKVDGITKRLKILQRKYNAVVIAISSINRANYLLPIDFESFKESGSIEYSADVVWGLELQIINDQAFTTAKNDAQRRKLMAAAKAACPRKVELVCLKNRFGIATYRTGFLYYPQFELFTPDPNFKQIAVAGSMPQIIV